MHKYSTEGIHTVDSLIAVIGNIVFYNGHDEESASKLVAQGRM